MSCQHLFGFGVGGISLHPGPAVSVVRSIARSLASSVLRACVRAHAKAFEFLEEVLVGSFHFLFPTCFEKGGI